MAPTMQVACKAFIAPNSARHGPRKDATRKFPIVQDDTLDVLNSSGDAFLTLTMPSVPGRWHRAMSMPTVSHPRPLRVRLRGAAKQNRRRGRAAASALHL